MRDSKSMTGRHARSVLTTAAVGLVACWIAHVSWSRAQGQDSRPAKTNAANAKGAPAAAPLPVILLTGFEPFGEDRSPNPSWEGVKNLDGKEWRGFRLVARQLRVIWGQPRIQLQELIDQLHPVAIFSFGQGGSDGFALECKASNTRAGYPDNDDKLPASPRIVEGGPKEFDASNDNQSVARRLADRGFRVRLSKSAGRYLCEEALYTLEFLKSKNPLESVAFTHVPPLGARVNNERVDGPYVERFVQAYLDAWHDARNAKPEGKPARIAIGAERDAFMDDLATTVAASIVRKDTKHPVFHGCIDWHSAVHGHWSLLRLARATGRYADEARLAASRLGVAAIAAESDDLANDAQFEMPYGRAWFLRLAIEFDLWCVEGGEGKPQPLADMADKIAASLAKFLAKHPKLTPATREYHNHSWAVLQLHDFLVHRQDAAGLAKLAALIDERFVRSNAALSFAVDRQQGDFFSPFGNWAYLVARTQSADAVARFFAAHVTPDDELRPVYPLRPGAHHLGVNWSRAWALRAMAKRETNVAARRRYEKAFDEHVKIGMQTHSERGKDYWAYGHWVPQFAIHALTE